MERLKELVINAQEECNNQNITQHFIQVVIQADVDTVLVGEYIEFDNNGAGECNFYYKYAMSDLKGVMSDLLSYDNLEVQVCDETEWGKHSIIEPYDYIKEHVSNNIKNEYNLESIKERN